MIFQNFDGYPGFQKISGVPILLKHSVSSFHYVLLQNRQKKNSKLNKRSLILSCWLLKVWTHESFE